MNFQHMLCHNVLAVRNKPFDEAVVAAFVQNEHVNMVGHDDVFLNHDELGREL